MSTYRETITSVEDDGSYVLGYRVRQCRRTLLTDDGVLTCQRRPRHPGHCAVLVERDGREVLMIAEAVDE